MATTENEPEHYGFIDCIDADNQRFIVGDGATLEACQESGRWIATADVMENEP